MTLLWEFGDILSSANTNGSTVFMYTYIMAACDFN